MKIRYRSSCLKETIEIDPEFNDGQLHFAPLISINVYQVGEETGNTAPRILSTYGGQLNAFDAGLYAAALDTASFIATLAEGLGSLKQAHKEAQKLELDNAHQLPNKTMTQNLMDAKKSLREAEKLLGKCA